MIFYTTDITPRLRYITEFIGQQVIGKAFILTTDVSQYKNYEGPRINYSNSKIADDEFWLLPHSLLFEKGIRRQLISCFEYHEQKAFFKTGGDLSFDIFAASFYLLSRYEEYLPYSKDIYGRYAHENSLAFKENFLQLPLINIWLQNLKEKLRQKFSLLTPARRSFSEGGTHHPVAIGSPFTFLPTYDIDEAYSYKHKSWWRNAGAVAKAVLGGQWSKIRERRNVLKGKEQDPYNSYDWMDQLHGQFHLEPRYFFLVAECTGRYDRNILPKEKALRQLIKRHAEKYKIGIHPSWQSGDNHFLIQKETAIIRQITGNSITISRQHFIRFTLPETFRYLANAGIKEDFSMGYGSINGFRASVASPFYWYDLEKEETTSLLLHPFCFMDANSFFEQKYSPQQALEEMRHYYREVKAVNGTLITLWHNTFLGTDPLFAGWREVYRQFIEEIAV